MDLKGTLVEYLDNGKFVCALVEEDTDRRLRLLTHTGRESSLPANRVLHTSRGRRLAATADREAKLRLLQEVFELRSRLAAGLDLQEVWESLESEVETSFATSFLNQLAFGQEAGEDSEAALLRRVFADRLFFRYKSGEIIAHSADQVEAQRAKRRQEEELERFLERSSAGLAALWKGEEAADWPEKERCLQLVADFQLHDKEAADSELARELLKRAGLTFAHAPYHLLVKAGHWRPDENQPLLRQKLPVAFSPEAMAQAEAMAEPDADRLLRLGYRDFRHLPLCTIDGEQTRDYDDALHVEARGDNLLVGIHIACVAHFVRPATPLFQEAVQRATSLYFPEGQVPMLPAELSENLCSLIEGRVRPALSFLALIGPDGRLLESSVAPSVVTVKRRLSYRQVNDTLLAGGDPDLALLADCGTRLRNRRVSDGALLLPFPDVIIEPRQDAVDVRLEDSETPSRVLVAELMILANIIGAGYVVNHESAGLFRSQAPPRQRLFQGLQQDLFLNIRQRKRLSPMELLTSPKAHSGIGAPLYTTITSPIRRALDLVMQQQILGILLGEGAPHSRKDMKELGATLGQHLARAGGVRQLRHRYWLLRHLEGKVGQRLPALLIDKGARRIQVLLLDTLLEADLPVSQAPRIEAGSTVSVRLERADALDNLVRLAW